MTTVLVTGGCGFLGSHVVELALRKWEGLHQVRIFDLALPNKEFLNAITNHQNGTKNGLLPKKVRYYCGNLLDMESLTKALVGVTIVFHCAAAVENGSFVTRSKMYACNVQGTQNVIKACLECGVKALVSTGSVIQYLTPKCRIVEADESLALPAFDKMIYKMYGRTKAMAEHLVQETSGKMGQGDVQLYSCVIRCPGMFGERENNIMPTAIKHCEWLFKYLPRIGSEKDVMQSMYAGNAAWAHLKAGQALLDERKRTKVSGKAYFIGDETPLIAGSDYLFLFLEKLHYKMTPFKVPIWLVLLVSFVLETIAWLLSHCNIDIKLIWYGRGAIKTVQCRYSFSYKQSEKDFGYKPLYGFEHTRQRAVQYYSKLGSKIK